MSEADVIDESAASTPRRVVHYVHEIRYHVSFIEASTHPATSHLADAVRTDGHSARPFVVIDRAVDLLHGEALRLYLASHGLHDPDRWLAIDASAKDGRVLDSILHRFIDVELERHAVVLAVGGGTVLDVAGLAASLHRRGTSFVRVPTSLVGVIDAAVGVKTGIDYRGRKNRLGSYAPPRSVLIDLSFLDTLPEREWRNGLAEAIKMGAIADAVLFAQLKRFGPQLSRATAPREVVALIAARSIDSMLAVLGDNLLEDVTLRRPPDFGHTISPRLEMVDASLRHGEAVAMDMAMTVTALSTMGIVPGSVAEELTESLRRCGLATSHPACTDADFVSDALEAVMRQRSGALNLPYPHSIGGCRFAQIVDPSAEERFSDVTVRREDLVASLVAAAQQRGARG